MQASKRPTDHLFDEKLGKTGRRHQVVQSFWLGGSLSIYELCCIRSFIRMGHKFHLYSYEPLRVPRGVKNCDARTIIPIEKVFWVDNHIAPFADVFRYELLNRHGGWWVDCDVVCLAPRLPDVDIFMSWEDNSTVNNAVLKAPAMSKFTSTLVKEAQQVKDFDRWGALGPALLTRIVRDLEMEGTVAPKAQTYPLHWTEAMMMLDPHRVEECRAKTSGSTFLHLWNEIFRLHNVNKTIPPVEGSFLYEVFMK